MDDKIINVGNDTKEGSESKHNRTEEEINKNRHIDIQGHGTVIDLTEITQSIVDEQKAFNSFKASWSSMATSSAIHEMQKMTDQYKNLWAKSDLRSSCIAIHDQFDSIRAHLESVVRHPAMQDIQKVTDQYKKLYDSSNLKQSVLEIQKAYESARIAAESSAITKIINDVQSMAGGYREFFESPAYPKLYDIMKDITSDINISAYARTVDFSHINIANIVKEYGYISEIPIVINSDGTISSQSMTLSIDEIRSAVDDLIQKHIDSKTASIEALINSLIFKISELKEPLLKRIFIGVIIAFISTLIFSFVKPQIDESIKHFSINRRVIVKEIQKEARTHLTTDAAFLKNFRFVSVKCLNMHANSNRKSTIVNILYFGSIVRIVEKRKNWSFVEYVDSETNKAIQGWVFTRYIEKLR